MYGQRFPRKPVHTENRTKRVPKVAATKVVRKVFKKPAVAVERNVPPPEDKRTKHTLSPEMVLLVLLISIVVALSGGLLIRFFTRGPRMVVFSKEPTGPTASTDDTGATTATGGESAGTSSGDDTTVQTGGTATPGTCEPSEANTTDSVDEPIVQPVGQDKHNGSLPEDVKPEGYVIAMNLTGVTLGPAMNITGRVDAHLHVFKNTDKVVVMAKAETLKDIRVAMLRGPPSPCSKGRGLAIISVSRDSDFVIVRLKEPLVVGRAYTLVTVHTYQPASGGPITLKETLGRMQLESGKAHAAFPCYNKKGVLVPIKLSIFVPSGLTAIANELIDCNAPRTKKYVGGTKVAVREWRFEATLPMPLHKLAWAVLPPTLKAHYVIPGLVRQFGQTEDLQLKAYAKTSFPFLARYFQQPQYQYITKLDIVLATEDQTSIGFLLLKRPATIQGLAMCRKIAEQWTRHLLPQYSKPSWLAFSGVAYLCRLAFAENEGSLAAAFRPEIEKCLANAATDDIKRLLAFRMTHISQGDTATKKSIQKYVDENLFKDAPANDTTLDVFAPGLSKENIEAYLTPGFEIVKLERSFGAEKKLTWKQPKAKPALVATNAVSSSLKLKTPEGFHVSWLDASQPETKLVLADKESLFVNPGIIACQGVELDNVSWALVGHRMETEVPHVLNADYLLSQASKQFANVSWPHDIAGFLWACVLLKGGDNERWNQYGKQFVTSEYHAYTMLVLTKELDKAYKQRVDDIIKKRVEAINPATELHPAAEKTSLAVALANVACFIHNARCHEFTSELEGLTVDGDFKTKVQATTHLAPEAVACHIASKVVDDAGVEATLRNGPPGIRLAFAACLPEGIGEKALEWLAIDALSNDLDLKGSTDIRLSRTLRENMLDLLVQKETSPILKSREIKEAAIKRAIKLRVVRSSQEAVTVRVKSEGEPLRIPKHSSALKALDEIAVDEYQALDYWIKQRNKT